MHGSFRTRRIFVPHLRSPVPHGKTPRAGPGPTLDPTNGSAEPTGVDLSRAVPWKTSGLAPMNVFREFKKIVAASLAEVSRRGELPEGLDGHPFTVDAPKDRRRGDIATNVALAVSRLAGAPPRDIAERIVAELAHHESVDGTDVAGPGFINIRLSNSFWRARLVDVLNAGDAYGESDFGQGQRINVEYVSANPTGPLHIGHARGGVFGDALAALLEKVGYEVTREYYVNDAGAQIAALADSIYHRYRTLRGDNPGELPEGLYPGAYLNDIADQFAQDGDKWLDAPRDARVESFGRRGSEHMLAEIRKDLEDLGISFDHFVHERDLHRDGAVSRAINALRKKSFVAEGFLEPPKGRRPNDWEPRKQTLFLSSKFGDDVDRPVTKSDGTWTYFAADIAYHNDKISRRYSELIDVWGADHGGYVKRMSAVVEALTDGEVALDVKLCQLVRVTREGVPVKMSKRAGTFITLREVLDEVGRDVLRFIMLTRRNDAPLDFDLVKVMEQSKDNPVFYVQYAHARSRSALRNARAAFVDLDLSTEKLAQSDLTYLTDPGELALIKTLAAWPQSVEAAAQAHEPHRLAFFLSELAAEFHVQWNKGNENPELRFIVADNPSLSLARLALVRAVGFTIASGLRIFGVEPVHEMR